MVGSGAPAALRILENEGAAYERPGNKGHCNKGLLIRLANKGLSNAAAFVAMAAAGAKKSRAQESPA
jgi:hypothetical protein